MVQQIATQTLSASSPSPSAVYSRAQKPFRYRTSRNHSSIQRKLRSAVPRLARSSPPARCETSSSAPLPQCPAAASSLQHSIRELTRPASPSIPSGGTHRKILQSFHSRRQSVGCLPAGSSIQLPRYLASTVDLKARKPARTLPLNLRCLHPLRNTIARSKCSPPTKAAYPARIGSANSPQ